MWNDLYIVPVSNQMARNDRLTKPQLNALDDSIDIIIITAPKIDIFSILVSEEIIARHIINIQLGKRFTCQATFAQPPDMVIIRAIYMGIQVYTSENSGW